MLFSATIPPQIESLIRWAMEDPETIEIGARRSPAETVKHVIYAVADSQKPDLLRALLDQVKYDSVIFCRTKHRADQIVGCSNATTTPWRCSTQSPSASGAGVARIPRRTV